MKDIKIDVDFKDTCVDFGKYVCSPRIDLSYSMEDLWEEYQEKMGKEVKDILTDDNPSTKPHKLYSDLTGANGIEDHILGSLDDVKRYNDYYTNTVEKFPLNYEDWYLLDKDKGFESNANPEENDFGLKLLGITREITELLIKKNKAYGNTALNPSNIFSKLSSTEAICARLDDKLARIKNKGINDNTEDTVDDLIGYLLLLKMSMK